LANFALRRIESYEFELDPVYKLEVNGKCIFDKSWKELGKKGYNKELEKIWSIIALISIRNPVSPKNFKPLKKNQKNEPFKKFELIEGQIRFYCFFDPDYGYIFYDGHLKKDKKTQDRMTSKLAQIIQEYYHEQKT